MEWVVRAGEAKAPDLMKGYSEHDPVPGLYGFSVQYQPGISWQELARAGRFPNARVSIAYDTALHQALQSLGYDMRLLKSPGKGYRHTFMVVYDVSGVVIQQIPDHVAQKLYETFQHVANPHQVRSRRQP